MKRPFKSGSLYFGQSGMHFLPMKTHWSGPFAGEIGNAFLLRLRMGPTMPSCLRFIRVDVGWEPSPDVTDSPENDGKLDKVVEVDSGLSGNFTPGRSLRIPGCKPALGVVGEATWSVLKTESHRLMAVRMDTPS